MRILLILAGICALGFGALSALERPFGEFFSAAVWFGGGIALHDGLFAPLCLAAWFLLLRRAPVWVSVAGFLTAVLVLLSIPVLPREGSLPNTTVLDRDYTVGLLVAVALVWVIAAVVQWVSVRRSHLRVATGQGRHAER